MGIWIDPEKCTGCGACEPVCPFGVIEVVDDVAQVSEGCNLCGACVEACAEDAIIIEAAEQEVSEGFQGVWVFAEQRDGKLKSVAYELLTEGRKLADKLGTELCAVCLGHNVEGAEGLVAYGADRVYLADDPALADHQEDYYTGVLVDLIRKHKPEILLAGATAMGRSFIPRVAAIIYTGLTADCTGLDIDPESKLLLQTRPTFGGNVMATITCQAKRPQMATVRPHVFKRAAPDEQRRGEIIKVDFNKESVTSRTRLLSFVEDLSERVKLDEAESIVSGGRGLGKPENFQIVAELADALGAALGSSRPPVDDGWIPYSHQVGQTGKTVCPKLYVACGISGAVQHLAGMLTAEVIVAINEDPNAPIFEVATYGIVGDLFKVVPMLTDRLKKTRGLA
ncbi:MAG: electron transfer flavoprotein subunit alpha [Dehalococcoidia bacterium]|nr:MAG: electron transfer flavoprotein subunit alpha [Dehalococcoidia bacterium]